MAKHIGAAFARRIPGAGGGGGGDPFAANVVLLVANDNKPVGTGVFLDYSNANRKLNKGVDMFYAAASVLPGMVTGANPIGFTNNGNLVAPSHADFGFGTGDFTVEGYCKREDASGGTQTLVDFRTTADADVALHISTGQAIFSVNFGITSIFSGAASFVNGAHWAVSRTAGTIHAFVNGVRIGAATADTRDYGAARQCRLFRQRGGGTNFDGLVGAIRVTKGVGRYTAPFTPPSGPFPVPNAAAALPMPPKVGVYPSKSAPATTEMGQFQTWLGTDVDVATMYVSRNTWAEIQSNHDWSFPHWQTWKSGGANRRCDIAVPLCPEDMSSTLAQVAAGAGDAAFTGLANKLAQYGLLNDYIRLAWEYDGTWYPWSAPTGSGLEANFAAAFRRAVDQMRAAQPTNTWKFVLCQTLGNDGAVAYKNACWPGDTYVDLVGMDLYDWSWVANSYPYPDPCDAACHTTRQTNAWNNDIVLSLARIQAFANNKNRPFCFPEWGLTDRLTDDHGGLDDPDFVDRMADHILDEKNSVVYHSYFNQKDSVIISHVAQIGTLPVTPFPLGAARFLARF